MLQSGCAPLKTQKAEPTPSGDHPCIRAHMLIVVSFVQCLPASSSHKFVLACLRNTSCAQNIVCKKLNTDLPRVRHPVFKLDVGTIAAQMHFECRIRKVERIHCRQRVSSLVCDINGHIVCAPHRVSQCHPIGEKLSHPFEKPQQCQQ